MSNRHFILVKIQAIAVGCGADCCLSHFGIPDDDRFLQDTADIHSFLISKATCRNREKWYLTYLMRHSFFRLTPLLIFITGIARKEDFWIEARRLMALILHKNFPLAFQIHRTSEVEISDILQVA